MGFKRQCWAGKMGWGRKGLLGLGLEVEIRKKKRFGAGTLYVKDRMNEL